MSKLMVIVGILFAALGIALGLMVFFSPGSMQVYGLTLEVAALFLVGGVLAIGQGGLIGAAGSPVLHHPAGASLASPAPVVAAAATAAAVQEPLSPAVHETIKALEQAKSDLRQAFEEKQPEPAAAVEPEPEPEPAAEELPAGEPEPEEAAPEEEGQLYVVEERTVRGRPARILSDGTVEAETSEGWMRFENLEHLDEYLDAMEPGA
jgi:hypothetical protein